MEELYFDVDGLDQLSKQLIGLFAQDIPLENKKDRIHDILTKYLEFNAKLHKNKLYFTEEVYSLLTAYRYTIFEPAIFLLEDVEDSKKLQFMKDYVSNYKHNNTQIENLRNAIENVFRKLLGVV